MTRNIVIISLAGVFAVSALYSPFGVARVQAAPIISNEQVQEQYRAVLGELVDVLREDVKLLQMVLIQKLEAKLAALQAQQS